MPIYRILFFVLCIGICGAAFWAPLTNVYYTIYTNTTSPIKVALLSDLHSGRFYQEKIIDSLIQNAPDLIVMSGDIIDDKRDMQGGIEFFDKLNVKPLDKILKIYVSGNHEVWTHKVDFIKSLIKARKIIVLDFNNPLWRGSIKDNSLIIGGVDDPYIVRYQGDGEKFTPYAKNWDMKWQNKILEIFTSENLKNSKALRIFLSHRPEYESVFTKLPFDIIMSGHTHGAQVRIPYVLNGLYAPHQGFFPKYAGGVYALNESQNLVVSRGLSLHILRPRIFNPPEITYITLQPQ